MHRASGMGTNLIRLYTWERPVVSFGRNERVVGRFDPARIANAGFDVARRPTGGRALLHNRELTYAVAGPANANDTLHATYERLSAVLMDTLRRLGVDAHASPPQPRTA